MSRIIYCGMEDVSGESCLYDKVALRFKGGKNGMRNEFQIFQIN